MSLIPFILLTLAPATPAAPPAREETPAQQPAAADNSVTAGKPKALVANAAPQKPVAAPSTGHLRHRRPPY